LSVVVAEAVGGEEINLAVQGVVVAEEEFAQLR
jgi:hypothetical protein